MSRLEKIKLLKALSAGQIKLEDIFPKNYTIYIQGNKSTEFYINEKPTQQADFFSSLSIASNAFKDIRAKVQNLPKPKKT